MNPPAGGFSIQPRGLRSRLPRALKEILEKTVVRTPFRDWILESEFLSRRYREKLFHLLHKRGFLGELRFHSFGTTFNLPSLAHADFYSQFEPETVQWLVGHLRPSGVAVDVGAHVGYLTVLMATLVGPAGTVYAVEPAEDNLHFLRKNVEENRLRQVRILPFAAGDRSGRRSFHLKSESWCHGFHADELAPTAEVTQVRQAPLDELIVPPVDLVKIDVEGGIRGS